VTSHPIAENHGHWWLTCGKWRRLHAITGTVLTADQMRDHIDHGTRPVLRAACTLRRRWSMPGMFSRVSAPRCAACCRALGIPAGNGTPANENYRQEQP
jgi:hypothetical protein